MSGFFIIVTLIVVAFIARSLFTPEKQTNEKRPEAEPDRSNEEGYGLYSDDAEMDRLYTDLDDTDYFEDMMDD